MRKYAGLLVASALMIILCGSAWGQSTNGLFSRLQPLNGYIVQLNKQGVLIDCGQDKGVQSGDVFSVIISGDPLVHPRTGKVIGRQEQKISLLKVIRVDGVYSVTVPLSHYRGVRLLRGQQVKRASGQKLLFIDASGTNTVLYSRLKESVPQVVWEEYNRGLQYRPLLNRPAELLKSGDDLYLIADRQRANLYNADFELISSVPLAELNRQAGRPSAGKSGLETGDGLYSLSTADNERVLIPRYRKVDTINLVVKSMDMGDLTGDHQTEVVFTDSEKIYVYTLTRKGLKFRYRYHFDKWGEIMNLQVADIDGDQRDELIVNTVKETEDGFSSFIIGYRQGKFQVVASNVPFAMGVLGGHSIARGGYFLGQVFSMESVFGSQVYQLKLKNGQIKSTKAFAVPHGFRICGALYDDINGDGRRELCFVNEQSFLEIYQGGKRLWISDERVGGSLNNVQVEVGTPKVSYTDKKQIDVPLRACDLDSDGKKEMLLVKNTSSMSTGLGEYGFLNKGSVMLLKQSNVGFSLRPLTGKLGGPIQSLNILGKELFVTMVKRGDDVLKVSGDSYLLSFPLPGR
ncbi:MAG: VCBS repeat-containing protein [Pseudomonadota bacterium]|nr:VCBS repeat-containing protein [Pseudomonadota bacterium]